MPASHAKVAVLVPTRQKTGNKDAAMNPPIEAARPDGVAHGEPHPAVTVTSAPVTSAPVTSAPVTTARNQRDRRSEPKPKPDQHPGEKNGCAQTEDGYRKSRSRRSEIRRKNRLQSVGQTAR